MDESAVVQVPFAVQFLVPAPYIDEDSSNMGTKTTTRQTVADSDGDV